MACSSICTNTPCGITCLCPEPKCDFKLCPQEHCRLCDLPFDMESRLKPDGCLKTFCSCFLGESRVLVAPQFPSAYSYFVPVYYVPCSSLYDSGGSTINGFSSASNPPVSPFCEGNWNNFMQPEAIPMSHPNLFGMRYEDIPPGEEMLSAETMLVPSTPSVQKESELGTLKSGPLNVNSKPFIPLCERNTQNLESFIAQRGSSDDSSDEDSLQPPRRNIKPHVCQLEKLGRKDNAEAHERILNSVQIKRFPKPSVVRTENTTASCPSDNKLKNKDLIINGTNCNYDRNVLADYAAYLLEHVCSEPSNTDESSFAETAPEHDTPTHDASSVETTSVTSHIFVNTLNKNQFKNGLNRVLGNSYDQNTEDANINQSSQEVTSPSSSSSFSGAFPESRSENFASRSHTRIYPNYCATGHVPTQEYRNNAFLAYQSRHPFASLQNQETRYISNDAFSDSNCEISATRTYASIYQNCWPPESIQQANHFTYTCNSNANSLYGRNNSTTGQDHSNDAFQANGSRHPFPSRQNWDTRFK